MFLCTTVDPIMGYFPLLGEDTVVLHNHLLDLVGG